MNKKLQSFAAGFTIIELMVAVAIMLLLLTSIGLVFKSASRSVGTSQALMEMLSNSSSIQQQMERDIGGMDKNAFLVIRSGTFSSGAVTRRCDQISFISYGRFSHRTGVSFSGQTFSDRVSAPAGFVWWGQLAIAQSSGGALGTDPSIDVPEDQTKKLPLNQVPTGQNEADFCLGRHVMLLAPMDSTAGGFTTAALGGTNQTRTYAAYQSVTTTTPPMAAIDYNNATLVKAVSSDPSGADITQSRVDLAMVLPSQLMSYLKQTVTGTRVSTNVRFEADHFCYRYAALKSPYDSSISILNGYYRMHPLALQGVPTFAVDWTDGSTYGDGKTGDIDVRTGATVDASLKATTRWYGMGNAQCGNNAAGIVDPAGTALTYPGVTAGTSPDAYTAIFSFDNRAKWPVAIRFRYHIADVSGRLSGGRDVVQIVRLPS